MTFRIRKVPKGSSAVVGEFLIETLKFFEVGSEIRTIGFDCIPKCSVKMIVDCLIQFVVLFYGILFEKRKADVYIGKTDGF